MAHFSFHEGSRYLNVWTSRRLVWWQVQGYAESAGAWLQPDHVGNNRLKENARRNECPQCTNIHQILCSRSYFCLAEGYIKNFHFHSVSFLTTITFPFTYVLMGNGIIDDWNLFNYLEKFISSEDILHVNTKLFMVFPSEEIICQ